MTQVYKLEGLLMHPNPQTGADERELVRRLQDHARKRERAEGLFDLLHDLLKETNLQDDDKRLTMRMGYGGSLFNVTINKRSVFAAYREYVNPQTGLYRAIQPEPFPVHNMDLILPQRPDADIRRLQNVAGYSSYLGDGLLWVRFSVPIPFHLPDEVRRGWHEAIVAERDSGNGSSVRKWHQSVLYFAAVDSGYRQRLFDQVRWQVGRRPGSSTPV
jgi:hypothetical protein